MTVQRKKGKLWMMMKLLKFSLTDGEPKTHSKLEQQCSVIAEWQSGCQDGKASCGCLHCVSVSTQEVIQYQESLLATC